MLPSSSHPDSHAVLAHARLDQKAMLCRQTPEVASECDHSPECLCSQGRLVLVKVQPYSGNAQAILYHMFTLVLSVCAAFLWLESSIGANLLRLDLVRMQLGTTPAVVPFLPTIGTDLGPCSHGSTDA